MIGLDSCAIIDFIKSNDSLGKLISSSDEEFLISDIIYMEVMAGLDNKNKVHRFEEEVIDDFVENLGFLKMDKNSIKLARNILWDMKRKGKQVGVVDAVIASVFISNGVDKIITRNKKHFEGIKGLKVISY